MKNIALIANSPEWVMLINKNFGGGNVVAHNIYKVLLAQGYKVTIISFGKKESYTQGNLTVKYINYPVESNEFKTQALIEAKNCDKIINFMTNNIFDGVIIQSHSYLYRVTSGSKISQLIKTFLYRGRIKAQKTMYSEDICYAYAVSKGVKEDFEKNLGLKNIKVSYPGCEQVFEEFNDDANEVLKFGLIASSSINKSAHYCVFVLGLAKLLGLKFKFEIIAPKYEKDIFMKFLLYLFGMKKSTNVLPKQNNMSTFYKSIDCVIMPSRHEAFGLVPLEALAFCKTCLVSSNIGFAELIDERSGFKFNRESLLSFLKELLKLGNMFYNNKEKYNEIRKNGWAISKKHTWENFVKGLLD